MTRLRLSPKPQDQPMFARSQSEGALSARNINRSAIKAAGDHAVTDAVRIFDRDREPRLAGQAGWCASRSGQAFGKHGASTSELPERVRPTIPSIPARYIQPAEPVYQVQPPRPAWGGVE